MAKLLEILCDLNDLILQGKLLEAFDKYYHDDVVIHESENLFTLGKSTSRKRIEAFFLLIIEFRLAKPLNVTIGEGISMVEWYFDYTHESLGVQNYTQISVQEWKEGLIIRERNYYNSLKNHLKL